ncbi:MAG: MATE family efflux transporter [Defluviitaleaceae bacterium]|nr:MATE family efflux transporter [Defluviitaleaceae bacterium]
MKSLDLTSGSIWTLLIRFAAPLLMGHFLQQLYNAFDAVMVGHYVGRHALAAVGSSGALINMIVSFFVGLSGGASVLISRFYGGRNYAGLKKAIHTAVLLSIILGVVLSAVGFAYTPYFLRLLQTPEEIIEGATIYLRIYFSGLIGLTVYNMGAAVLTATGDSKRPLLLLFITAVLHIILNLIFVTAFGWGVAGVAWSTVISQLVCAALVIVLLCRSQSEIRLDLRKLKIHRDVMKDVLSIGLPGGLQGSIVSGSNMVVQSYFNRLGADIVAAQSTYGRIEAFIFLPVLSMGLAVSTFVAQNLGAKQVKRARDGVKAAIVLGGAGVAVLAAIALIFSRQIFGIFSGDEVIYANGMAFMRVFAPAYFLIIFFNILPGALRGAGDVKVATVACIGSFVVIRQIYLFFVTQWSLTITTVSMCYPITWFIAVAVIAVHYLRTDWNKTVQNTE